LYVWGLGALIFAWPETPGIAPRPQDYLVLTERLTEFVVIIALIEA
jgi:sodium/hydrogen antiporter